MTHTKQEIETMARQTLVDHQLYAIPVNPVVLAGRLGVRVLNAVFSEPKLAGLSARRDGVNTILVRQNDPPTRKRFTVAHELAHCILHLTRGDEEIIDADADLFRSSETEKNWSGERRKEFEANAFAAALLMPPDLVSDAWSNISESRRSVGLIARLFQVSEEAMAYRLQNLGLV